jgi:endo-1,4-beta-D-glucanase Y
VTAVRANLGSWKKIADPQDLVIFNQARKKFSQSSISQEGRPKSHPSFTSLLQNNLFRETVFSLLQEYKKQENRDHRIESPFQHYSKEGREDEKEEATSITGSIAPSCINRPEYQSGSIADVGVNKSIVRTNSDDLIACTLEVHAIAADRNVGYYSNVIYYKSICVTNNFGTHTPID